MLACLKSPAGEQMRSQLDASQRSLLAAARASLLQRMSGIREQRQNTFAAVSVALLQQSQVCTHCISSSRQIPLCLALLMVRSGAPLL